MPDTNPSSPRVPLNVSESRLVAASRGAGLTSASAGELRKKIARARALRDKWRDVYMAQRRDTQQARTSRATTANRRSREKSELFGDVLARFEARLDEVGASGAAADTRPSTRPSPRKRTRQHRQERSRVKRTLAETVAERESAGVRSARASLPPMQTRTPPKKKATAKKTKAKQAGAARRNSKAAAAKPSSRPADVKARDQSRSAAARHRTKVSGLTTRIRGHVSAQGKRSQARRDRR